MVLLAGLFLHDRFLALESHRAVLTGATITLRAPLDGVLSLAVSARPGQVLEAGPGFASISNPRTDASRAADLRAELAMVEGDAAALRGRLAALQPEAQAAEAAAAAFRSARLEQLGARLAEADAGVNAARARLVEADAAYRRAAELAAAGVGTRATLEQAGRGRSVAAADLAAIEQRRATLAAERRAADAGVFISDVGTDRSASQQMADRLRLLASELQASLAEREGRAAALHQRLLAEAQRMELLAGAAVQLPARARLVALSASPGEEVRAGQELARFADCGRPLAEAEVDERTFRSLAVGMAATFVPSDGGSSLPGRIARLTSPAGGDPAPGLDATRYRVSVSLDGAASGGCATAGAGRLRFGDAKG